MSAPLAVLVTGASGGIGEALAERFARDGHRLVLAARGAGGLERVAGACRRLGAPAVRVVSVDLARPEGVTRLLAAVEATGWRVDVLVNNAGVGLAGPFAEAEPDAVLGLLQLNVVALTQLTRALLPGILASGRGGVLNVASTAAFQPGPYMAVYYASKAYVLSFSEALAAEVAAASAGRGVRVTALAPGPTHTGFAERAGVSQSRLFRLGLVADVAAVADAGYAGFRRGRRVVVPGLLNKVQVQALRLAPRRLVARVAAAMNRTRVLPAGTS
ncbi:MAG TPA: SDR family oxidoreductase [Gemmatimonadales bacterium]|nr:SDR family oxidoreductase [Gemmatimonadales bacterium]